MTKIEPKFLVKDMNDPIGELEALIESMDQFDLTVYVMGHNPRLDGKETLIEEREYSSIPATISFDRNKAVIIVPDECVDRSLLKQIELKDDGYYEVTSGNTYRQDDLIKTDYRMGQHEDIQIRSNKNQKYYVLKLS